MSGCPTCSNWIAVTAIVLAIQFFPTACLAQEPLVAQDNSQHLALMQLVESLEPYHPKGEIKGSAVISGSTTMQSLMRLASASFTSLSMGASASSKALAFLPLACLFDLSAFIRGGAAQVLTLGFVGFCCYCCSLGRENIDEN